MGIDMAIPFYTVLAIECLLVAVVSVTGYFIIRQTVRGVRASIAYLQAKKACPASSLRALDELRAQ